jgi:outer membrane protein assembly factor BamD
MLNMHYLLLIILIILQSPSFVHSQEAKTLYEKAEAALLRKDYETAKIFFKRYLRIYPKGENYADCLYNLGVISTKQNNLKEAIEYYSKFSYFYPTDERTPQILIRLAELHLQIGDKASAINNYRKILDCYPHAESLVYLAKSKLISLLPTTSFSEKELSEEALLEKAKDLYEKGEYQKAQDLFAKFINLYPNSELLDYAHIKIAECLYYKGDYNKAYDKYNEFIKLFPKSKYKEYADYAKGWCKYHLKDFNGSILIFSEFIKKYPDSKYLDNVKKVIERCQKVIHEKEARDLYNQALTIYKEKKDITLLEQAKDKLLLISKDYQDTKYNALVQPLLEEIEKRLAELIHEKASELYKKAWELAQEKKINQANQLLDTIINKYPDPEYKTLAEMLKTELTKLEEKPAISPVSLFKELKEPENHQEKIAYRYYKVAEQYFKLGEYNQAIDRLEHLKNFYPDTVYAKHAEELIDILGTLKRKEEAAWYYQAGLEHYKSRDYNRALLNFEKILRDYNDTKYASSAASHIQFIHDIINEDKAKNLYIEGKEYQLKGDFDKALSLYEKILSLYPQSFWALYARYAKAEILYFHDKDYKSAIREWEKVLSEHPGSNLAPHSLYHIALCFEALGEDEEAYSAYIRLKSAYPKSVYSQGEFKKVIESKLKKLEK